MDVHLLVVPNCPNGKRTQDTLRHARPGTAAGDTPIWAVVHTVQQAEQLNFPGSPTIQIDGADPIPSAEHSTDLACRMFAKPSGPQAVAEMGALVAAIRPAAAEPEARRAAALYRDRRPGAVEQAALGSAGGR